MEQIPSKWLGNERERVTASFKRILFVMLYSMSPKYFLPFLANASFWKGRKRWIKFPPSDWQWERASAKRILLVTIYSISPKCSLPFISSFLSHTHKFQGQRSAITFVSSRLVLSLFLSLLLLINFVVLGLVEFYRILFESCDGNT